MRVAGRRGCVVLCVAWRQLPICIATAPAGPRDLLSSLCEGEHPRQATATEGITLFKQSRDDCTRAELFRAQSAMHV